MSGATCPGSYFSSVDAGFSRQHGRLRVSQGCRPAMRAAPATRSVLAGTTRLANSSGPVAPSCSPPLSKCSSAISAISWARARPRRIRSRAGHPGHHRKSLAARLRVRIQLAVRSRVARRAISLRNRTRRLRQNSHCEFRCRSVCVHQRSDRSSLACSGRNHSKDRLK